MKASRFIAGFVVIVLILSAFIYFYPQKVSSLFVNAMRTYAGLEKKSLQVGDHRMVYLEGGQGETVILVHGFGGNKDNWLELAPYLTSNYHVIAVDLPGFGESTRDQNASYSISEQAERLHVFIHTLHLSKVNLAGNSMGGLISGLYAVKYPQDVASLALLDAAGVASPHPADLAASLKNGQNPLIVQNTESYDHLLTFVFYKIPEIPGFLKNQMAAEAVQYKTFNEKVFSEIYPQINMLQPQLNQVKCPVLILWGDHDSVLDPSSVEVFKQGLTDAALVNTVIIKDCGHLPMTEKPAETSDAYQAFLQSSAHQQI